MFAACAAAGAHALATLRGSRRRQGAWVRVQIIHKRNLEIQARREAEFAEKELLQSLAQIAEQAEAEAAADADAVAASQPEAGGGTSQPPQLASASASARSSPRSRVNTARGSAPGAGAGAGAGSRASPQPARADAADGGKAPRSGKRVPTVMKSGVTISRRQFWEVFTDYSQIRGAQRTTQRTAYRAHNALCRHRMPCWCRTDNQFLALPVEYYDHFARGRPDGMLEVKSLLLLMALFCNSTLSDQLNWMFVLFDTDGDGTMAEVRPATLCTP